MRCPSCKTDSPAGSVFCRKCATPLKTSGEPGFSVTRTIETRSQELTRGMVFAGRYEIIEVLGTGGMGRVYRAQDTKLNEEIALKLIKPEVAAEPSVVERFRNELKTARRIRHKNVCGMYDFHEEGETFYLTMEYVRGEDLKSLIHRTKVLSTGTAVSIARQIAEGLGEAHKLGITHRDLKPGNIMIDRDGQAKIMDFGIARVRQEKGITGDGAIIGTPEYMSPEQVDGKPADPRSDLYSLGVILFEMIIGHAPFEGETPFSIANKHKAEPPPVPKKLAPQIPDPLNRLILRCLEKDKATRYQTTEDLVSDLDAVAEALPLTDRMPTKDKSKTRASREITVKFIPRKAAILAATLTAAGVLGIFVLGPLLKKKIAYPPPVDNSFIIVSFENNTGDKSQDALRNVFPDILRTKFEQTGVRYVATRERMTALLKQAGKPDIDFIESDLGFELARRDGVKALVAGSYGRSGNIYVTTLRVLDIETRASLATANASGTGLESILTGQIDDLCRQVFSKLNFSRAQIDSANTPVIEYSTSSLGAYKNYVLGIESFQKWNLNEARRFLENAIAIDPGFFSSYLPLAYVHLYLGESDRFMEYLEKAQALRAKAPDKEKLEFDAAIAFQKEGDLERGIALTEEIVKQFPKDIGALTKLAVYYRCYLGRYDESSALYAKALELDPSLGQEWQAEIASNHIYAGEYQKARDYVKKTFPPNSAYYLSFMGDFEFREGKLDEAIDFYGRAKARDPAFGFAYVIPNSLHYIRALKEDWPGALIELDNYAEAASTPELKFQAHLLKAIHMSCLGMTGGEARELSAAQGLLGEPRGTPEGQFYQALIDWTRFWIAYERNDLAECQRSIPYWPERSTLMYFSRKFFKLGSVLTRGSLELKRNRMDLVQATLGEMGSILAEKGFYKMPFSSSTDAERARFVLANFQAEVWLAEGSPAKAVAALAGLALPEPPDFQNAQFLIIYLTPFLKDALARAYEQLGNLDQAIAEYEKLLRIDPKIGPRFLPHPRYHYRLAKLYEKKGDKVRAASELRRFLELWKAADAGQPDLEDAKARLVALTGK
jgi:serine/threonine protein kinase/tetratricopeptide (TPR) repeat protein